MGVCTAPGMGQQGGLSVSFNPRQMGKFDKGMQEDRYHLGNNSVSHRNFIHCVNCQPQPKLPTLSILSERLTSNEFLEDGVTIRHYAHENLKNSWRQIARYLCFLPVMI